MGVLLITRVDCRTNLDQAPTRLPTPEARVNEAQKRPCALSHPFRRALQAGYTGSSDIEKNNIFFVISASPLPGPMAS